MHYHGRFVAKINSEYFFVICEDNSNDCTFYIEKCNERKTIYNDVSMPEENQCVYGNKKCIYFAGWLYIIDIENAIIEKYIYGIDKLFFLTNCIVYVIKNRNRFDEFLKININDLSVESLGNLVFRNMLR